MTKSMLSSASHSRAARPTSASSLVRRSPGLEVEETHEVAAGAEDAREATQHEGGLTSAVVDGEGVRHGGERVGDELPRKAGEVGAGDLGAGVAQQRQRLGV